MSVLVRKSLTSIWFHPLLCVLSWKYIGHPVCSLYFLSLCAIIHASVHVMRPLRGMLFMPFHTTSYPCHTVFGNQVVVSTVSLGFFTNLVSTSWAAWMLYSRLLSSPSLASSSLPNGRCISVELPTYSKNLPGSSSPWEGLEDTITCTFN